MTVKTPTSAILIMTTVTLVAIIAAAVLVPEGYPTVVGNILMVVTPTLTALLALLRSSANGQEIAQLHNKADELKQEATHAKEVATVVNLVVEEKIAPAVEAIAKDVEVLKGNGHGDEHEPQKQGSR